MRTRTRTILSLVLFIGVPVPSFAGDPYEGFVKFSGHWKVRKCSLSSAPAFPDLGIGLTESRLNAVNVYFLNSKGKKAKLHFSTSSVNRDQGHITPESTREARIIVDRSDETGIRVSLQETGNVAVVEIIKTSATDLVYQRKMAGETFSCTFSSTAPE